MVVAELAGGYTRYGSMPVRKPRWRHHHHYHHFEMMVELAGGNTAGYDGTIPRCLMMMVVESGKQTKARIALQQQLSQLTEDVPPVELLINGSGEEERLTIHDDHEVHSLVVVVLHGS